jgi:hypothetical protein
MNEQMVKRREQNRRAKRLSQSEVHLCPMSNTIGLPTTPSSLQILIDKSPVVCEEFIAFGGRRIDLLHDFKKGRVEYSDS